MPVSTRLLSSVLAPDASKPVTDPTLSVIDVILAVGATVSAVELFVTAVLLKVAASLPALSCVAFVSLLLVGSL